MKKMHAAALATALLLILALFTGCFGGSAPDPAAAPPSAAKTTMDVVFSNGSDFIFNELYISPSAANEWGPDQLGSTSILKSNGSVTLTLDTYDFNTYDVKVVDEDDDIYLFQRLPLNEGTQVAIGFSEDGLVAVVGQTDGSSETFAGVLESAGGGEAAAAAPLATITGTGNDTNGYMEFTVYNESDYDIFALHVGVSNASADADLDLLPAILPAYENTVVSAVASQGDWLNTEWTMFVVDVDGDTSASYETFNPWLLLYVDIYWDSNIGGYVCNFVYE